MNKTIHKISTKQMFRQILFLCIPTIFIVYVLIFTTSDYFPLLNHKQYFYQTLYFSTGIFLSCIFHSYKLRFLPAFIVLLLLFGAADFFLDNFAPGEFDSFFLSIDFLLFRSLFLSGWICGWGFSRSKYFPAILSVGLLALGVIITALSGKTSLKELAESFAPALIFAFYIIFMNELLRNTDEEKLRSWFKPVKGLVIYAAAMALILFLSFNIFNRQIKSLEAKWDSEKTEKEDGYNLYDVLPDSTVKMKETMSVTDRLNRGDGGGGSNSENVVLFVAHIDNFFPMSDIPNPLYLVSEYMPLFDDETETFECDTLMPENDMFAPDPSKIPLYFTATDTSVLQNDKQFHYKKVVETEIYKVKLAASEFTAPATAFYCQPIAVKDELLGKYTSAYRAKSWVSELNSAYFVYNNTKNDWEVQEFQSQRFDLLREIQDFSSVDTAFFNYYTRFPKSIAYDTIKALTQSIIDDVDASTPIDKILAVRNFFMKTDELGIPRFKYSDVATTLPPGSRILNFLLNEHTGNCTYYAGSTFLMLRACGIPTRVVTGYAVVDRSSNNKGWYWIYNKQAHAWIQVFFPEYGWLDFDTTFGDSEQSEAPATDGTPPLDPQKAWFAATGEVLTVDTVRKSVQFIMKKLVCFDKEFILEKPHTLKLDLSQANLLRDSLQIKIQDIRKGNSGLALSFTQTEEVVQERLTGELKKILRNLPEPLPVDRFRLDSEEKKNEKIESPAKSTNSNKKSNCLLVIALSLGCLIVFLLIVIFSIPYTIFCVYSRRAKRIIDPKKEAYYPYRAAMFMLNQFGFVRNKLTPLQYADQLIDKELGTSFGAFTATYLKVKYAHQELTNEDSQRILTFYKPFEQAVKSKTGFKKRFLSFLNIYNTLEFFTKPQQ